MPLQWGRRKSIGIAKLEGWKRATGTAYKNYWVWQEDIDFFQNYAMVNNIPPFTFFNSLQHPLGTPSLSESLVAQTFAQRHKDYHSLIFGCPCSTHISLCHTQAGTAELSEPPLILAWRKTLICFS